MSSIPVGDPDIKKKRKILTGNVPDPSNPPTGCYFHPRCCYATDKCSHETPLLRQIEGKLDRNVACHYAEELHLSGYNQLKEEVN